MNVSRPTVFVTFAAVCALQINRELAAFPRRAFDVLWEFEISIRLEVSVFELGQIPTNHEMWTYVKNVHPTGHIIDFVLTYAVSA